MTAKLTYLKVNFNFAERETPHVFNVHLDDRDLCKPCRIPDWPKICEYQHLQGCFTESHIKFNFFKSTLTMDIRFKHLPGLRVSIPQDMFQLSLLTCF